MKSSKKTIEVVAGPNGSGKTTFASSYLVSTKKAGVFLNPDIIASGFNPASAEKASMQAGRVLLAEIKSRIERGESFAFESTLSGLAYAKLLAAAKARGYEIIIYFIHLKSVHLNVRRIKARVRDGGHDIPRDAVLRRQLRCFDNFWNLYRPLAVSWYVFDNSFDQPELVLAKSDFDRMSGTEQSAFAKSFAKAGVINGKT